MRTRNVTTRRALRAAEVADHVEIGFVCATARCVADISQQRLAVEAGVSQIAISRFERGEFPTSPATTGRIVDALIKLMEAHTETTLAAPDPEPLPARPFLQWTVAELMASIQGELLRRDAARAAKIVARWRREKPRIENVRAH